MPQNHLHRQRHVCRDLEGVMNAEAIHFLIMFAGFGLALVVVTLVLRAMGYDDD